MKITRLTAILFVILSLVMVLALVGCQDGNNGNGIGTGVQDACNHESSFVNSNCEEACAKCGQVLSTGHHEEFVTNAKCEEVCARCGEVSKTDVHAYTIVNDKCELVCNRCGKVVDTDAHAETLINDKCEEVCVRCGKVFATGLHDEGQHNEACEVNCIKCGELLATDSHADTVVNEKCEEICSRCGKVLATGAHAEGIVNDQLQQVCSRCGEVYIECVHDEGVVVGCVRSCGNCGEIIDAEAHLETVVNAKCEEVCADCGKVFKTGVHAEGVVGADCTEKCSRCKAVLQTEVHADKVVNDKCEESCSRCGKVYNTGVHAASVESYTDDRYTDVRTYFKACSRCGGNVEYSFDMPLGVNKPAAIATVVDLAAKGLGNGFNKSVVADDYSYITFNSKTGASDAFFYAYTGDGTVTGRYVVIKYRTTFAENWEFFVSAGRGKTGAAGGENFYYKNVADGEWHVVVFDLAKLKSSSVFAPNADGTYSVDYFRWDIFNNKTTAEVSVDVAYIAFADNINALTSMETELDKATVVIGSNNASYDVFTETGTPSGSGAILPGIASPFYQFNLDKVSGGTAGKTGAVRKTAVVNVEVAPQSNGLFTLYGWAGAYADIDKYQYSVDGGITWNDFVGGTYSSTEAGVVSALKGSYAGYGDVTSIKDCRFQNIAADLSEFYGQNIAFTFGALLENGDRVVFVKFVNVNVNACAHSKTTIDDDCKEWCAYCGEYVGLHDIETSAVANGSNTTYTSKCGRCGHVVYDYTIPTPALFVNAYDVNSKAGSIGHGVSIDDGMALLKASGAAEDYFNLFSGNTAPTRYVVIEYASNTPNVIDFFGGSERAGATDGLDMMCWSSKSNGDVRVAVLDLSAIPNYKSDHTKFLRFDPFNNMKSVADPTSIYFKVKFVAVYADLADAAAAVKAVTGEAACDHNISVADDNCNINCAACGTNLGVKHSATSMVYNATTGKYDENCKNCGRTAREGVGDFNVFFDAAALADESYNSGSGGGFTEKVEDGVYKIIGDGVHPVEVRALFVDDAKAAVEYGQYLVIKYKANITVTGYTKAFQVYASTEAQEYKGGLSYSITADGEWHILVVDLAGDTANYKANAEGEYIPKRVAVDFINPPTEVAKSPILTEDNYVWIDYLAFCDDLRAVEDYVSGTADAAYCSHSFKAINNKCEEYCQICGKVLSVSHATAETSAVSGSDIVYTGACTQCGTPIYSYTVKGAATPKVFQNATALVATALKSGGYSGIQKPTLSADGTYVTYTNKTGVGDAYAYLYLGNSSTVTGQYLMVKYRVNNGYAGTEWFIGANNGRSYAAGGDTFYFDKIKDGEWQIVIIDLSKANTTHYLPNADGTYSANYIRWDVMDSSQSTTKTVDIAYAAISDSIADLVSVGDIDAYTLIDQFNGKTGQAKYVSGVVDNPMWSASILNAKSGQATLKYDAYANNMPYVRYVASKASGEERFTLIGDTTYRTVVNSGAYIAYMYRKAADAPADNVDLFLNSTNSGPTGSGDSISSLNYVNDGKWHLMIVDLSAIMNKSNAAYYDPATGVSSLSIDWFNKGGRTAGSTYVDVALVAMFDSESQAIEYFADYFEKYNVTSCGHDYTSSSAYVTDGKDSTDTALYAGICRACGQADNKAAPFVVNIESVTSSNTFSGHVLVRTVEMYTYKTGAYNYDGDTIGTNASGAVGYQGWAGIMGSSPSGHAYKIVDATTGEELVGWTTATVNHVGSAEQGVQDAVVSSVPGSTGFRFEAQATLDNASLSGKIVNVIFAFVTPEGAGNDIYIPCFTIANVVHP